MLVHFVEGQFGTFELRLRCQIPVQRPKPRQEASLLARLEPLASSTALLTSSSFLCSACGLSDAGASSGNPPSPQIKLHKPCAHPCRDRGSLLAMLNSMSLRRRLSRWAFMFRLFATWHLTWSFERPLSRVNAPQRVHDVEVHVAAELGDGAVRRIGAGDGVRCLLHLATVCLTLNPRLDMKLRSPA